MPLVIWVSEKGNANHGPRIKVSKIYGDKFNVTNSFLIEINSLKVIGDTAKIKERDINKIKEWIVINKELLLKVWNSQMYNTDFINNMKKSPKSNKKILS